jgi:hypothetical protein
MDEEFTLARDGVDEIGVLYLPDTPTASSGGSVNESTHRLVFNDASHDASNILILICSSSRTNS